MNKEVIAIVIIVSMIIGIISYRLYYMKKLIKEYNQELEKQNEDKERSL